MSKEIAYASDGETNFYLHRHQLVGSHMGGWCEVDAGSAKLRSFYGGVKPAFHIFYHINPASPAVDTIDTSGE